VAVEPNSAANPAQAAAAATSDPDPAPAYIRPELIYGANTPKSTTTHPYFAGRGSSAAETAAFTAEPMPDEHLACLTPTTDLPFPAVVERVLHDSIRPSCGTEHMHVVRNCIAACLPKATTFCCLYLRLQFRQLTKLCHQRSGGSAPAGLGDRLPDHQWLAAAAGSGSRLNPLPRLITSR
jgi:hypothetical protein